MPEATQGGRPKNKGGRPAKTAGGVLSKTMAFRLRPSLEQSLRDSALLEGRSMSEEVEARLNRSMQREAAFAEMFGSPEHQKLLLALGNVVRLADALSGGPECATAQVNAAVIHLIEQRAGKKAAAVLDDASKTGHEWRSAAENVALLEKGMLQPRKSMTEIMGR